MFNMNWTKKEKKIAKKAYGLAYERQIQKIIKFITSANIKSSDDLWSFCDELEEKRTQVGKTFDYRYSVLPLVFMQLVADGLLEPDELEGLSEEQLTLVNNLQKTDVETQYNNELYTLTINLLSTMYADDPWKRVIEIPADATLIDLHDYIQVIIEFDDDHMFEFYTGKNQRDRKRIFGFEDDFSDQEFESLDTSLNEIYPADGLKLYYLFDFGDSWLFEIKKGRKKKQLLEKTSYPRIIEKEGKNPDQYPEWE